MLSNAYFLAKFRFDTAENEPAKNLENFRKMHFRKMHFRKVHFRSSRPTPPSAPRPPARTRGPPPAAARRTPRRRPPPRARRRRPDYTCVFGENRTEIENKKMEMCIKYNTMHSFAPFSWDLVWFRSLLSIFSSKIAEMFADFLKKVRNFARILLNVC